MLELSEEKYLLMEVAKGDSKAFSMLYDRYRNKVYTHALAFTRSVPDAEDITADCFLRLWNSRHRLPEVTSFKDYLFILVRNQLLSAVRKRATEPLLSETEILLESALPPDEQFQLLETSRKLQVGIDKLSVRQKRIFLLSKSEGLTYQEIAHVVSLTERQVKYEMVKALGLLREYATAAGLLAVLMCCISVRFCFF